MDKKAQGMSVNVIIIVAIGLIVLVVLIALFTGRLGGFSKGVDASQSCNAVCGGIGGSFANKDKAGCTAGRFISGKYSGDILGKEGCCCEGVGGGVALQTCSQACNPKAGSWETASDCTSSGGTSKGADFSGASGGKICCCAA